MTKEVLRLEGVNVFRQSRPLLSDVNLVIRPGERWALIGPNGAGKSTLLGICGAEQHPTRGHVRILEQQLGRVEIRKLRESIGHVNPRHPLRSALSVREVVLSGATGTVELMNRWTPSADLEARAETLIELLGLGDLDTTSWPTMSQGERGRALIARALLPEPPLLLLDEPPTGLDVAAREQLLSTLDRLHHSQPDLATVLVTHHFEELPETTTHALLLSEGQIISSGPVQDVLTSEQVSACFDYPITIEHREGRWLARAGQPPESERPAISSRR